MTPSIEIWQDTSLVLQDAPSWCNGAKSSVPLPRAESRLTGPAHVEYHAPGLQPTLLHSPDNLLPGQHASSGSYWPTVSRGVSSERTPSYVSEQDIPHSSTVSRAWIFRQSGLESKSVGVSQRRDPPRGRRFSYPQCEQQHGGCQSPWWGRKRRFPYPRR